MEEYSLGNDYPFERGAAQRETDASVLGDAKAEGVACGAKSKCARVDFS